MGAGGGFGRKQAPARPSFSDAIHLVHGGSAAGHLKALGAKRVLFSMDSLTTGPASSKPVTHSALRQTYWRDFYRRLPRPADRTSATAEEHFRTALDEAIAALVQVSSECLTQ